MAIVIEIHPDLYQTNKKISFYTTRSITLLYNISLQFIKCTIKYIVLKSKKPREDTFEECVDSRTSSSICIPCTHRQKWVTEKWRIYWPVFRCGCGCAAISVCCLLWSTLQPMCLNRPHSLLSDLDPSHAETKQTHTYKGALCWMSHISIASVSIIM